MQVMKALALLVFTGSLLVAAPVKDDPAQLPLQKLPQYFNKRRNLDRWLQQGSYGPVFKMGKDMLKEFVEEDPYVAYCIAAAYGSMEPDPEGAEDYYAESLEYLEHAIDWGFRNVDILKTSLHFEKVRKSKDHAKKFEKLVDDLAAEVKKEQEKRKRDYPEELKKRIADEKAKTFTLDAALTDGTKITAEKLAGKPLMVFVLRPRHDAVEDALAGIRKAAAAAKEKGVQVLGAIYNFSYTPRLEKEAKAFAQGAKLSFPCAMVDRSWTRKYGVLNLPAHLLVSAGGKVLCRVDGYQDEQWRLMAMMDVLAEAGK
jgi:hypothetical protein